jgi:hypothetical protein
MAKKLDLNKLREEIDKEKKSKNMVPSQLGESVGGASPRDEFLKGLLVARESGAETPSTTLLKTVENKVAEKKGEVRKHAVNENVAVATPTYAPKKPTVDMSPDREQQMYQDMDKMRKQTLAESISNFHGNQGTTGTPTPPTVNFGGQQYLTSLPANTPVNENSAQMPMQINEAALVENVKNVVNGYLSENLGAVFEEAIKGTIIEMYAVERIKEVLTENRDLIKTVVVETIREIQARNKAKAQS